MGKEERKRERERGGGGERKREREREKYKNEQRDVARYIDTGLIVGEKERQGE